MKEVNTHYDKLETCFPRSKRITSDSQAIQDWCVERFTTGDKAAEEGDHAVDHQGQTRVLAHELDAITSLFTALQ